MAVYKIGDLATFTYNGKRVNDRFPKVLILHDQWEGFVHGMNFNYLTDAEINYLRMVLNPEFADKEYPAFQRQSPLLAREFDKLDHVYNTLNISSPHDFYIRFIKSFIRPRGWDPYRKYNPAFIASPRVLKKRTFFTGEGKKGIFSRYIENVEHKRGRTIVG